MKQVVIHTDGAAKGNPGRGGFGVVLEHDARRREISDGFERTTNNRMELLAAIRGLEALKQPCRVTLHSDSRYLIDAMSKGWLRGWKARGWSRAKGQHLKNADLWKRLAAAATRHEVEWRWVKGHAGHKENECCDDLADAAAGADELAIDHGFLEEEDRDRSQGDLF